MAGELDTPSFIVNHDVTSRSRRRAARNFPEPTRSTRKGPLGSVVASSIAICYEGTGKGERVMLRNCYGVIRDVPFEQFRAAQAPMCVRDERSG
jgi:hypothetical protein